jgi:hypothetical protein
MEMTSGKDWIPTQEDVLVKLVGVWQTRLASSPSQAAYGWVVSECTATAAALAAFMTAYTTYQGSRTQGYHDLKEEAKKTAIAAMRKFANERICSNEKMNTRQREELGIFPHDPEPAPVPKEGPESRAGTSSHAPGG